MNLAACATFHTLPSSPKPAYVPGDDDDLAPGRGHSCQLVDELWLVRHVLAALHRPDQVEGVGLEGHPQSIRQLKAGPGQEKGGGAHVRSGRWLFL